MKAFCLYGGIGSMAYAARKVGCEIIGNIEPRSFEDGSTFKHNFPGSFFSKDLKDIHKFEGKVDLLLGHPSCGAFSSFNIRGKVNQEEILNFFEAVKVIKPEFFIVDNLEKAAGFIKNLLLELIPEYNIFPQFITNKNYGNPQIRKRLYVIGSKKEHRFFPIPNEVERQVTVKDRISHLLGKEGEAYGHYEPPDRDDWSRMSHVLGRNSRMTYNQGKSYWKLHKKSTVTYYAEDGQIKSRIGLIRVRWDEGACNTLTGSTPKVHPIRNSNLTIKESLLLMGYGEDFEIPDMKPNSDKQHKFVVKYYKKIRKAVCIESMEHFIGNIRGFYTGYLKDVVYTREEFNQSEHVNRLKLALCNKQKIVNGVNCMEVCKIRSLCKYGRRF